MKHLKTINENNNYDREEDENGPKLGQYRKPLITLKKLNKLKTIRNNKREELAQSYAFIPHLYGPQESDEQNNNGF